jgi:BMFP domain-containing protein YqiC
MSKKVSIDQLEDAIIKELEEYASLASDDLKDAVRKTAKDVRTDIRDSAPVRTGKYKRSWSVKKVSETADSINLVVHSRNRYQIAHLLEHGHAKRGGGRVAAMPHIAPAEQKGNEELEKLIKQKLKGG